MQGDSYNGWHVPERVTWGRHSYGQPRVITYDQQGECRVVIGDFCSIASGVEFLLDGEHRHDFITQSPMVGLARDLPAGQNRGKGSINIGHDVWIGRGARILSGVAIAPGAVVGAYTVVASDVPAYAVVVGNPARVVRYRFTKADIATLLKVRWWDWPDEKVLVLLAYLRSPDVGPLLSM